MAVASNFDTKQATSGTTVDGLVILRHCHLVLKTNRPRDRARINWCRMVGQSIV